MELWKCDFENITPCRGALALFQRSFSELRTIGGVVDGGDDAGSEHDLLPGLANVDNIDTVGARLPQVRLHVNLEVLGTEMRLSGKEHLDVLRRRVEDGGKVGGSHLG